MTNETRKTAFVMSPNDSYKTVSTFLPADTSPNPIYGAVDALWQGAHENPVLDDIAAVVSLFMTDGVLDEVAYLAYVEEHFSDDLDDLMDEFLDADEVEPIMPSAPSPKALYNRVSEVKVVDVGSGDCTKLSRCQAKSVTPTDFVPVENPHYDVQPLDANSEIRDFMETKQGHVITSYNTLTQLDNPEQVLEHDGVHIFPDMVYIKANMSVVDVKGRLLYGDHHDRDAGIKGDNISEGYVCLSSFAVDKIDFQPIRKVITRTFSPQCEDVFYKPVDCESTPKYDGECMFLASHCGKAALSFRNGKGYKLEQTKDTSMVLMLEKLPKRGEPEVFVLLRVMQYKGYYPFHGLRSLERFCKNVRVRIGGARVLPPGHPDLDGRPFDGQVYRIGQIDFRYKPVHTVDLDNPLETISILENRYGYAIEVDEVGAGLCEYSIFNANGKYGFKYKCVRADKTGSTSVEKIAKILSWI